MHVFLTGATGFIGQALVRAMRRARGWDVTALVRRPDGEAGRWIASTGGRLVAGDVTRPDGLREAMAGADVVLHNAGVYELGADAALVARMHEVNVGGTEHVLRAAAEAGVPRTVHVSSVMALGDSGGERRDESWPHPGRFHSEYERTKHASHQVALAHRARGLPLAIGMPNVVVGANDHATFGHFLRLYLQHRMPPVAWGRDTTYSFIDVDSLADGLCRIAERAPMGEDYVLGGDACTVGAMMRLWSRHPGGMMPRLWLPTALMRPQMALMEPLLRRAGLPAFMSREVVDVSGQQLNYSSEKARRELGWRWPDPEAMWDRIVREEAGLLARRRGFLARLRTIPVVPD